MLGRIGRGLRRAADKIGPGRMFGALVLAGLLLFRIWDPVPLQLLRLKVFDTYQLTKPREAVQRPVVIVDIDEASLSAFGQWPWPRTLIADLVAKIAAAGAVVTGFDVVFPEPDRTSPHLLADSLPDLSDAAREEMRRARSHDAIFAETLKKTRVVLGQSAFDPKGVDREASAPKASFATLGGDPRPWLINFPRRLPNLKVLEDAALGRGMFTVRPDPDGVLRRVPVILVAGGELVPALSAEMLRVATGQTTFLVKTGQGGVKSVVVAGAEIPTDANGLIWVYYAPHERSRYVSAKDVIRGTLPEGRLTGKLVLIGTSASGLLDIKTTPIEPSMPGVEVHAQVLENVLTGAGLSRPSWAVGAEICLALAVGLAIILLAPILGAVTVFVLGFAVASAVVGVSWYSFAEEGILLDAAYPLGSSFAVFIAMMSFNYFREEAQKRQIRGAFGQYLSPALVEQLAENPDKLVLGGETREMTILFSDVRGFTSISESYKNDPQGLTALMNRFLTPLSNAIMESNGTIDKYMGDAIMAFWNAPLDDPDHAVSACRAAMTMLERLEEVNRGRAEEARTNGQAFVPLNVGIGINTGECVVGNMGSDVRFDYSVMGDSVNLASRLEGQTSTYGARTITGARTAALVGGVFSTVELDSIRVKGKKEPETIHAVLGRRSPDTDAGHEEIRRKMAALLAAYRKQDWKGAASALRAARKLGSGHGIDFEVLCALFEERIVTFRRTPPPKDWDGVFTLETK